jgi:glycosyltransferase involved in cell wall biosynthesis
MECGAMINVYVKCYTRAAYLDRCLTSIKRNLTGYERIILLDDGLPDRHLARILERHPDLDVRRSQKAVGPALPPTASPQERAARDPARFWVEEIGKDPHPFFLLLEEDTWLTGPLNLPLILRNMQANNAVTLRLFWNGNPAFSGADEVFISSLFEDGGRMDYYAPVVRSLGDLFKVFSVAHSVYRTDYWCNSYNGIPRWNDEPYALRKAHEYLNRQRAAGLKARFAKTEREMIRHCVSSTTRDDSGGVGVQRKINAALYNDAMNQAWLEGVFDPMAGYPQDVPEDVLLPLFAQRLTPDQIAAWRLWKEDYLAMYRRMGCALE